MDALADAISKNVESANFMLKCIVEGIAFLLAGIFAVLFILANQALKTWKGKQ